MKYFKLKKYIREMILRAHVKINEKLLNILKKEYKKENNIYAKIQYENMITSAEIAQKEMVPICQDTGVNYFYIRLSKDINLLTIIKCIKETINELNKKFLRENLMDPLNKRLLGNTIMYDIECVNGKKYLDITYLPKGAGSENVSGLYMLNPVYDINEIINVIINDVKRNALKSCPPLIVGIGIGGDFSSVTKLARLALIRGIKYNSTKRIKRLEKLLERRINELGIGPMGVGGRLTCIKVNIEIEPCHIATLPLAINYSCWPYRKSRLLYKNGKFSIRS